MATSDRATWTGAYINTLPDSSFLYVEPGGSKDGEGKTTPRSLRHFPYKDASGKVDLPHLRNALARIPQSNLPQSVKDSATAKAKRILAANSESNARRLRPVDGDQLGVRGQLHGARRPRRVQEDVRGELRADGGAVPARPGSADRQQAAGAARAT